MDIRFDLYANEPCFRKKFDFKKHGEMELDARLEENIVLNDIPYQYRNDERRTKIEPDAKDKPLTVSMSDVFKKLKIA